MDGREDLWKRLEKAEGQEKNEKGETGGRQGQGRRLA